MDVALTSEYGATLFLETLYVPVMFMWNELRDDSV
jgi:hypothetical protein